MKFPVPCLDRDRIKTGKTEDRDTAPVTGRAEEGFWKTEEAFARKEIQPVFLEELGKAPDAQGIVFLSALSQNKFRLYGYAEPVGHYNGIYITDWEGNMNSFPSIPYTSPRLILPKMGWDQENGILKASFHTMTGTSLSESSFMPSCDMTQDIWNHMNSGKRIMKNSWTGACPINSTGKNMVTFYDESEKIVSLPLEGPGQQPHRDVIYTDFVAFNPNQPVTMAFTPGFIIEGMMAPQYLESDVRLEAAIDVIRDSDSSGADVVKFHIRDIEKGGA